LSLLDRQIGRFTSFKFSTVHTPGKNPISFATRFASLVPKKLNLDLPQ
jgi:hypothetical protein